MKFISCIALFAAGLCAAQDEGQLSSLVAALSSAAPAFSTAAAAMSSNAAANPMTAVASSASGAASSTPASGTMAMFTKSGAAVGPAATRAVGPAGLVAGAAGFAVLLL